MPPRKALWLVVGLLLVVLAPSGASGWITSHPGAVKEPVQVPVAFGDYWRAEKADGLDVWTAPPAEGKAVMVMVHGYRQKRADLQQLAEHMNERGYGIVLLALPYIDGSEPYSGGGREAEAVEVAVRWTSERFGRPVVLAGYSAGGFASGLAVRNGAKVAALITDSALVDAEDTFKDVSSDQTRLPEVAFFALRPSYSLFSKGGSLQRIPAFSEAGNPPAFVIHGAADDFVVPSNAYALQRIFVAEIWVIDGANHGGAWYQNPTAYEDRVDNFITTALR